MNYLEVLPIWVAKFLDDNRVSEVRLRTGKPCRVKRGDKWFYVSANGLTQNVQNTVVASQSDVDECLNRACKYSVFAYEKELNAGFVTLDDGARLGVSGEIGSSGGYVRYNGVCVRVARHVAVASENLVKSVTGRNVVAVGKPHSGKTTFIRDLAIKLSQNLNVVVIDERGEISKCVGFEKAVNADVLLWGSRSVLVETAVRSLSPDVIVFDELSPCDKTSVERVASAGINVVCSVHGDENMLKSADWLKNCFDVAVLLDCDKNGNFTQKLVELT